MCDPLWYSPDGHSASPSGIFEVLVEAHANPSHPHPTTSTTQPHLPPTPTPPVFDRCWSRRTPTPSAATTTRRSTCRRSRGGCSRSSAPTQPTLRPPHAPPPLRYDFSNSTTIKPSAYQLYYYSGLLCTTYYIPPRCVAPAGLKWRRTYYLYSSLECTTAPWSTSSFFALANPQTATFALSTRCVAPASQCLDFSRSPPRAATRAWSSARSPSQMQARARFA